MNWLEQMKAAFSWLPTNQNITQETWGLVVFSTRTVFFSLACFMLYDCLRKRKNSSAPSDVSALMAEGLLTIDNYKEHLLELHEKCVLEKQKLEEIERKLANLEESYQGKLWLLEDSKEKLQQMADCLPKQQLAEAEERLAQGDTELAEQLFDQVAAETGQTAAAALLQSGRLAEDRLDCSKALRHYAATVVLAPDNPAYLLPAGQMAWKMGEYQQAEEWLAHLLAILEQKDQEDVELGLALNDLAAVYMDQGRYEEAEPLYKRLLEISEKAPNKDPANMATTLNNLAWLYEWQGRYEEAEPLRRRSLEIREEKFGKDHPKVGTSLNTLAELYKSQGRCEEAEPLCKRSLEILEKSLGEEHQQVAAATNNLAELHQMHGRPEEAERMYKRSLDIYKKSLGEEHPYVATVMNNLAGLYEWQERYEEAEPLYKRSLEIREEKLGKDHPDVGTSLNNLAGLYRTQDRPEEAEHMYKRSLDVYKKSLGEEHPYVATVMNNLAELYRKQERCEEAEPLCKRSLEIRKKKLGEEHPDVAKSLNSLALLYDSQKRHKEAEHMYKCSLDVCKKSLGNEHQDVAAIMNNLAGLYEWQERYEEAETLYQQALTIIKAKFPGGHPNIDILKERCNAMKEKMQERQGLKIFLPCKAERNDAALLPRLRSRLRLQRADVSQHFLQKQLQEHLAKQIEVADMLQRTGKTVSLEEMEEAVRKGAQERK